MIPEVKSDYDDGQNDAAQKLQAALPDSKDGKQIIAELVEIMNYVKQTRPCHAAYQGIKCSIGDKLRVGRDVAAKMPYDGNGQEKTDDHH